MSQNFKSADVQKTSDTSVQIKRSFNASKDIVFKAFTTPSLLKRWMLGPPGWDMPICEMELKEGGKFRWGWKNRSNGFEFGFFGTYRRVTASQEIVHTQTFDPGTMGGDMGKECLLTVTFTENAGVTTVTTQIKYQSHEDMEKALATGMTDGMEMSYQLLDGILLGR
jgi:uncharacterized protein YndB with AHSA1/START domain